MRGVIGSISIPLDLILAVPAVVIGIFGYRWIHRVMQATALVVGVSLVIMLVQGLRFGACPRMKRPVPPPGSACFWPGWRCSRSTCCRSARSSPTTPAICPPRRTAAAVLGDLRRERGRDVLLVRGRRLPRRVDALRCGPVARSGGCPGSGR